MRFGVIMLLTGTMFLSAPAVSFAATCSVAGRTATIHTGADGGFGFSVPSAHRQLSPLCGDVRGEQLSEVVVNGSSGRDDVVIYDAERLFDANAGTNITVRIDLGPEAGDRARLHVDPHAMGASFEAGSAGADTDGDGDLDVHYTGVDYLSLFGSAGADTLDADGGGLAGSPFAGDTYINGGPGADVLRGGAGKDRFDQASMPDGADTVSGGEGADWVDYSERGSGLDVTLGNNAADGDRASLEGDDLAGDIETVTLGAGDDVVIGSDLDNVLQGAGGNDRIEGGGGDDSVIGSAGVDILSGGSGNDYLGGGLGVDILHGGPGEDWLDSGDGDERLVGGPGNDKLGGGGGNDVAIGGPGDDTFLMHSRADGTDTYVGGDGRDTVDGRERSGAIRITMDGRANDGFVGERDNVTPTIEIVVGSIWNDTLVSAASAHSLDGFDGDDTLVGGGGRDTLHGGKGRDTINARDGATDAVDGGAGIDRARVDARDRRTSIERLL